jgi:hypothetical protein
MQHRVILPANMAAAARLPVIYLLRLENRHFRFEFHVVTGGHNWNQWDERLPSVF